MHRILRKSLISVKLDILKFLKGQKEGNCYIEVAFPKTMPKEKQEEIRNKLNSIVDDIREYM